MPPHSPTKGPNHKQQLLLRDFPAQEEDQTTKEALADACLIIVLQMLTPKLSGGTGKLMTTCCIFSLQTFC